MRNFLFIVILSIFALSSSAATSTYLKGSQLSESNQTITSSGSITTLIATSPMKTYITGTSSQTVKMPITASIAEGYSYHVINKSTQSVSVVDSSSVPLSTVYPNTDKAFILFSGGVWVESSGGSNGRVIVGASPIVVDQDATTATFSIPAATGSVNGYLTSTDWTTFNGKITAPVSCGIDQHVSFNGSSYVCVDASVSAGQASNYFLVDTPSGVSTYLTLSKTASTSAEETDNISLVTNNVEVSYGGYADGELGSTSIEAGLWEFNFYRAITSGGTGGTTQLVIRVFKRTSGGVETELFNVSTGDINDTAITLQVIRTTRPSFSINPTDILLVKISAVSTNAPKTVSFTHNGTARNSFISSPIAVRHNQLSGLQGGSSNEYYHSTSNQNTAIATLSATGTWIKTSSDLTIDTNKYFYFGDPATNNTIRVYQSSGALITEKRLSGTYVEIFRQDSL